MTTQSVLVDRTAAVATITMSAPALSLDSKVALRDALEDVAKDPAIRAVVLTGGGKAFCVGQDLAEHSAGLADGAEAAFATVREHYSPIVRSLLTMPKPVIAAVGGACVGAGLGFALACDYRVFAAGAKLGTAFTGIGLTFDSGLSFTLPRAVGDARAKELMLFGQMFTAEDGIAWGITGETVDTDQVLERAVALARQLAQGPTVAFAESKRLIVEGSGLGLDAALEAEAGAQTRCGETADHGGAVSAFLGREKPTFTGR
ncbi:MULTISPECIES: enoyl-CoA hydratase/isomerase family protein [unclassified Nocardioides]|uniref:enoyl-CoA hydratase/isomerase family protein n=1 Tax=unclassified Nocardioides TaxID=2615069 RepID=UPI0007023E45|nr:MULTISPECIES: enoyl-CoA hydratase-related protein [unclassified Nocardioides]KRC46428.1 enoyl-CoA hydratase [Nocardioides sp. Root79]KRC69773.1 enoyl-CoA hydratase [Nocardioides sp. Root240]